MGKKGTKRKTRWRVLPIGEDGGSGSGNEDEGECENVGGSGGTAGTYARATQQQRMLRRPNNRQGNPPGGGGGGGYYNKQQQYHHHSRSYNNHDNSQPLVTTEKQIFNEEEYTKITTPRQDVLFKKGYLGRKRPPVVTEPTEQTTNPADVANGNGHLDQPVGHMDGLDNDPNDMVDDHPQFIYTNGFVDQSGVYYINGSGYEIYDPYSGQVTVLVGPHYGPNGGPPVLAAVPCQPVPLQPLEWFNPPGFLPYVTAPCHNGLPRDRRKRYSTDSQNCSPQSSESTGPPGSPQESDEVALNGGVEGAMYHHPHHHPPPPYVYPGYMFGAPMYNMNGVTVQSTPNAAPTSDVGGKRRKKKRRRRRRRNGVEDGSEESSSEDKEPEEEPMSVTSQESSLESDSKLSNVGENPDLNPRSSVVAAILPVTLVQSPPPQEVAVETGVAAKSNVQTQTNVEKQEAVEFNQRPHPDSYVDEREIVKDTVNGEVKFISTQQEVKEEKCEAKKSPLVNGFDRVGEPETKRVVEEIAAGQPKLNGGLVNGKGHSNKDVVVNGDRLVNGHDIKPKGERKAERKGKKSNGLTNGVAEKPREVVSKQVEANDDFVFQDDSFLYTQEFINGNAEVKLEEESEWITVKGHKGSQGKRTESGRISEEKKVPSELTNGHAKSARDYKRDEVNHKVNGIGGKDKVLFKNSSDKLKTDKSNCNGKVEEKCTYSKVKQTESGNKEKVQLNGKGKLVNGNKMEGNEKIDTPKGKEAYNPPEAERKVSTEKSEIPPESPKDVPKKSIQDAEEPTPAKPSRKERKNLKNASPPKTPEVTLTATAKPFVMPSVSLRPETFVRQMETSPKPEYLTREDSLLSALTFTPNDSKPLQDTAKDSSSITKQEFMTSQESSKLVDVTTKPVAATSEKGQKSHEDVKGKAESSKVDLLKEFMSNVTEEKQSDVSCLQVRKVENLLTSVPPTVVKSLKETSKEFLKKESQNTEIPKSIRIDEKPIDSRDSGDRKAEEPKGTNETKEVDSDPETTPPVPPPRRKKWRSANKRLSDEHAPASGQTSESTDESSSSSSSQESEESVIECLSSGFNSPKVKVTSGFSSDDEEDIIYQGKLSDNDPKTLGRISESHEEAALQNGKRLSTNGNGSAKVLPASSETTRKEVSKSTPKSPLPQVAIHAPKVNDTKDTFSDIYKGEEHLRSVQKMAQDIVDSVIDQAVKESVRLKYQKDNDPSRLGITDAVTRWLRSQSPDVLSLPRNEDSESDISEDFEDDVEDETTTGSKNLQSNPLPVPSVKDIHCRLDNNDLIGNNDGTGRRVANTIPENKDLKDSRNDTPDLEDDVMSNDSISCGEWDLWDCQHAIAQTYEEILNKPHKKHTKNTNETNIISPDAIASRSPTLSPLNKSCSLVPDSLLLTQEQLKYDPRANDTFSPVESTLLNEIMESTNLAHDRCNNMCDPTVSVAKYYILGPHPEKTRSPIEDLECSDSDDSSSTQNGNQETYGTSLAEELAELEQPLPASWAVEPIKIENATRSKRCAACHCNGQELGPSVDSGVESGDESIVTRKRESMSVFKRKLVGRLKGEGAPFPCGGICCILQ